MTELVDNWNKVNQQVFAQHQCLICRLTYFARFLVI